MLTNALLAYAFRSDGRYFALAERHKSKDTIGIYDTQDSYKLVRVSHKTLLELYVNISDIDSISRFPRSHCPQSPCHLLGIISQYGMDPLRYA